MKNAIHSKSSVDESAVRTKGNRGLKEYVKKLNMQLKDIVQLVRGELTKLQRKTIGPLVVIDVHALDVIQDMIEQNVSTCGVQRHDEMASTTCASQSRIHCLRAIAGYAL